MLKKLVPKTYGLLLNIQAIFSPEKAGKRAFHVYCKVRKGKVQECQKAFLDKAKHQLIATPIYSLQSYHWPTKGKTVLLVHGWESNTYRWHILIKKLQQANFNIYAFDAPGHGYSTGEILHHPLYEKALQVIIQKYKPEALIGHSMGGMTALYNQYLSADKNIEQIVTIASPSEYQELMRFYKQLLSLSNRVLSSLEAYIKTEFGFNFIEFSTADFVKTNTKKGLLIHDKFDTNTPYWSSEQVHTNWKNSKLITTEGLGHSIQNDAINDEIIDFLKS